MIQNCSIGISVSDVFHHTCIRTTCIQKAGISNICISNVVLNWISSVLYLYCISTVWSFLYQSYLHQDSWNQHNLYQNCIVDICIRLKMTPDLIQNESHCAMSHGKVKNGVPYLREGTEVSLGWNRRLAHSIGCIWSNKPTLQLHVPQLWSLS